MQFPNAGPRRTTRRTELGERFMLFLSYLTIGLYLLQLRDHINSSHRWFHPVMMAIDLIFVADLAWKLKRWGRAYVKTPWFLIDLLSCLPAVQWLGLGKYQPPIIQGLRCFRIFRVLRTIRILRVLRSIPAFQRLFQEDELGPMSRPLQRAMSIGVVSATVVVVGIIVSVRFTEEREFLAEMRGRLANGATLEDLQKLGGRFEPSPEDPDLKLTAMIGGRLRTLYFESDPVVEEANSVEFFLVLLMLAGTMIVLFVMAVHVQDASQTQLKALLNLALPRQVTRHFLKDPASYTRKVRMPATILFTDFVGFTATCEGLADRPDELSEHLEKAMDRVVGELVRHDLIIDKFIGDAIMSFRGGPYVPGAPAEHAYRVVRGALEGTRALAELDDPHFHRMKVGIASAPDCLIGAFGTSARLTYTVLGDGVNLAARLEPASAQCSTKNLCCERTHALCIGKSDLAWRRWGRVRVKGKARPMNVYEAFDAATLGDPAFIPAFHRALEAFEHGDISEARERFANADALRPGGDPPSRSYVTWCEELLEIGTPADWEPVLPTSK